MINTEDTPAKKKDIESKIQKLFGKMTKSLLSGDVIKKLHSIVESLSRGSIDGAKKYVASLAQENWSEGSEWILLLKRMVAFAEKAH